MHDSVDWILIGKVVAGEATEAERQQLETWLTAHPEQRPMMERLRRFWLTPAAHTAGTDLDIAGAYQRLQQRIALEHTPNEVPVRLLWSRPRMTWLAAAASVALVAGFWSWNQLKPTPELTVVEQTNNKGTRSQIRLTDGSVVWLNADSHLWYPKSFRGDLREVTLEGEAFFQVTHDPAHPFVVRLKTGSVRVLGTSFNIRAYPGDSTVETSVVTGRVAFIPAAETVSRPAGVPAQPAPDTPDTLFLKPNSKAIQSLTRQNMQVQPTVAVNQIAWTESKLVFRNTPMGEVAKTLERWYGTPVTLERESLRQCPLTATFQNQSLREVMSLIAMTNRFAYELTPTQVTIKGSGCDGR
ncbi:MAG: FecR domain-containing protein [Bacteroidetes bacterium]|nr:FecR domain-containing protein [Fibrella sp.]